MDFLDGSDVDDENGDLDQDVENVLLGSDDDEATIQHHTSKLSTSFRGRARHSEEEEDVLNLVLQGDEEELDYEGDTSGQDVNVPPVKVRNSAVYNSRDTSHFAHDEEGNLPSCSNYDEQDGPNMVNFVVERRFAEDDGYDDADDEEENRNTRSRFTSERKVESLSGGHMASSSSSVGIPIQTVGERKIRPGTPGDGRPRPWGPNGQKHAGIRHPGRGPRFQNPARPGMHDGHMRPGMSQPVVQFNEGIFTDFNQPLRHPHPHPRMRPPHPGRFDMPRHEMGPGPNRPGGPPQNMRPFQPQHHRPGFGPNENRFGPPRQPLHPPGNMNRPQHPFPQDFNMRSQRPSRFPPNNPNQRGPRPPPHAMGGPHNFQGDRPPLPYPPRQQNPHYRGELQPQIPGEMEPRPQGFPPQQLPQNMPPDYGPHSSTNMHPLPRYMGHPPRPPMNDPYNSYYPPEQHPAPTSYHPVPEPPAHQYHQSAHWNAAPEPMPQPNHGQWMQQQQPHMLPQQSYAGPAQGYPPASMYDPAARAPNTAMMSPHSQHIIQQLNPSHMPITQAIEIPTMRKSIYIKPNSEIHEAISKSQLRHHLKEEERRSHEAHSSSSKHDDHYYRDRDRDRERGSSSRHDRSTSDRRRDDDYYEDRKSYQYHERRRRDNDRRRSESPERKVIRSERSSEVTAERRRAREEFDKQNKESEKLMEEAKKMGLGEDYVKKLEEQRKLRERILRTKEQRRKLVKAPSTSEATDSAENTDKTKQSKENSKVSKVALASSSQKNSNENVKEIEADSTVASGKSGKPKRILRIVRDKAGNVISKKVHVIMAKPQQDGQQ